MNVSHATTDAAALCRSVPNSETPAVSSLPKRQGVAVAGQATYEASKPKSDDVPSAVMSAAVVQLNDYVQDVQRSLRFSVDELTGRTVITVLDSETDEVIRQIPAEEVLAVMQDLARREAGDTARGILFRENV